jgi:hypothetical protein
LFSVAGPVWVRVALLNVVTPLRVVPPVSANVPGPRTNPPFTAAPLSVAGTLPATANAPEFKLNVRVVVAGPVNRRVPAAFTVIVVGVPS